MICIRHTISKISFSYIMYITIILCRNYLQIVRSNYVYFGQINESVYLSVFAISQVIEDNQIGVFCGIKTHRRTSHGHIFLSSVSIFYSAASCTDFQPSQLNLHKPCVFHKKFTLTAFRLSDSQNIQSVLKIVWSF